MSISTFFSRMLHKTEKNPSEANPSLLIDKDSSFGVLEAYRMTRTNIMYSGVDKKCPIIAITSAAPHEGKSLSCANLAISFALSGNKVLIIDGDMRAPQQDKMFGTKIKSGLSEYLAGIRKDPAIQKTKYENLFLLTSGKCPPNPAELLDNERFATLLADAHEEYDAIFIDLPPVALIADAAIVSRVVHGYVVVVKSGQSDSRMVKAAMDTISRVEGKVFGFLLNGIEPKGKAYGHYRTAYTVYESQTYGKKTSAKTVATKSEAAELTPVE